jgi:Ala-tRNA(Pro) deacylase
MSVAKKLEEILKANKAKYEKIVHAETFTSQHTAQAEHAPGKTVAKVVMVKADGKDAMLVVPSTHKLDLGKVKKYLGAKDARLASEEEFARLFPDCEKGAMPPFGELYSVPLFVDESMTHNDAIVFNAGTHRESLKMPYREYDRVAKPKIGEFKASS